MCAQWSELYAVPDQLRLQLQTEHLLHLLENRQTDEAFQVLPATRWRLTPQPALL